MLRIIIEIVISRLKPIYINSTSNCLGKITLSTNGHWHAQGGCVDVQIREWLGGLEVAGNREQLLGKQLEQAACSLLGDQPLNE